MITKNIEATILQHLLEFGDQLKRSGDARLQMHGITSQQWVILLHLANDPNLPFFRQRHNNLPVMASEMAEFFHVSRANIANLINALVEKKLIIQSENRIDRRRKLLQLTEEGKQLIKTIEPLRKEANEQMFSNFTKEEKVVFLGYVERCLYHLTSEKVHDHL